MGSAVVWFLLTLGWLPVLLPPNFSLAQRTTLCISQFALANQACALLQSEQALRGQNRTRSQADDSEGGNNDDDDDDDENDDGDDDGEVDESERRRRHGHKRSRGNKKNGSKNTKKKKKGSKHGGGHDEEPLANKDCCRWLEEMDESCVCDALLRLPPFLVKPTHKYSIKVGKSCKFTYNCYGI